MLKLTYTENGFHLEHLQESFEEWVNTRVLLALRSATSIFLEPSTAAFLLPTDLPHVRELEALAENEQGEMLELSVCDAKSIEVALQGTWISSNPDTEAGVFVCLLSSTAESLLYQLWQEAQVEVYAVND